MLLCHILVVSEILLMIYKSLFKLLFFLAGYQYPGFPQGPPPGHYGTYPGSFANQQGGYPNQKPPGW